MCSPTPYQVEIKTLRLAEPFRVAHGVSAERQVLRVHWEGAVGEAPLVPYYDDDPSEALRCLEGAGPGSVIPEEWPRPARLALDVLRLDHLGRQRGVPARLLLPQDGGKIPPGCRSLGIPVDLDDFAEKVGLLSRQFRVLKLKVGGGHPDFDEAIVARAREAAPRARLILDANGGWSPAEAARLLPRLGRWQPALVEQPVHHAGGVDSWRELNDRLGRRPLPIFADESAQTAADVPALAGLVDGVNVKLLKCATLEGVTAMIRGARARGLGVMLGCMIESSIGVTAAAQFAHLADWIDLDGHFYLADDDYEGLGYDAEGCLILPDRPGLGVAPRRAGLC